MTRKIISVFLATLMLVFIGGPALFVLPANAAVVENLLVEHWSAGDVWTSVSTSGIYLDYAEDVKCLFIKAGGTYRLSMEGTDLIDGLSIRVLPDDVLTVDDNVTLIIRGLNMFSNFSSIEVDRRSDLEPYTCTIQLVGNNTLKSRNGCAIMGKDGVSIVIEDYPDDSETGTLNAYGSNGVAAIGSINLQATLNIKSGNVNAYGGDGSAALGGFFGRNGGGVTISGGTVYALGGKGGAGIGSGDKSSDNITARDITITGGTVTAVGGLNGAGIGSGSGTSVTNINISGGTVIATGNSGGAGIGTGAVDSRTQLTASNINITGGNITATGGGKGAGIGGGQGACVDGILIFGGTINATGNYSAAGIGSGGFVYSDASASNIQIQGGTVTATGGLNGAAGIGSGLKSTAVGIFVNSNTTAYGGQSAAAIGSGASGNAERITIGSQSSSCNVFAYSKNGSLGGGAGVGSGSNGNVENIIVKRGVNLTAVGSCLDSEDTAGGAGVGSGFKGNVGVGGTGITIDCTGILNATGGIGGAGIGSGALGSAHNITINNGTVNANGKGGAGIGGGLGGEAHGITINGGAVNAIDLGHYIQEEYTENIISEVLRKFGGAGIGGGGFVSVEQSEGVKTNYYGYAEDILITGGTITATGSTRGAGIGGGNNADADGITITGGNVTAYGGFRGAGIGGGAGVFSNDNTVGVGKNITITGGTIYARGGYSSYDRRFSESPKSGAAGIGGGFMAPGIGITIGSNAQLTAIGDEGGAGIGGGAGSYGKDIDISGKAHVTATGGLYASGIGGGFGGQIGDPGDGSSDSIYADVDLSSLRPLDIRIGKGENITISGGVVIATAGDGPTAGIGGGAKGCAENIIITDGSITAIGGEPVNNIGAPVSIGAGAGATQSNVLLKASDDNRFYVFESMTDENMYTAGTVYNAEHPLPSQNDIGVGYRYAFIASATGDFRVDGGKYGTDYIFDNENRVLRIISDTPLSISLRNCTTTTDRIEVSSGVGADITFDGINIDLTGVEADNPAVLVSNSAGDTVIRLKSENNLRVDSEYSAALQKDSKSPKLTITDALGDGYLAGSLTATATKRGAAIGGRGYSCEADVSLYGCQNIKIAGGIINASAYYGAGIGAGSVAFDSESVVPAADKISIGFCRINSVSKYGSGLGNGFVTWNKTYRWSRHSDRYISSPDNPMYITYRAFENAEIGDIKTISITESTAIPQDRYLFTCGSLMGDLYVKNLNTGLPAVYNTNYSYDSIKKELSIIKSGDYEISLLSDVLGNGNTENLTATDNRIIVEKASTITLSDLLINSGGTPLEILAETTIKLKGYNVLKGGDGCAAVSCTNTPITITSSSGDGSLLGTLEATGGNSAAGIGGVYSGKITISGGTIIARGGKEAAGIGGNKGENIPNTSTEEAITIKAGSVEAFAGEGCNAIGAGAGFSYSYGNATNYCVCRPIDDYTTVVESDYIENGVTKSFTSDAPRMGDYSVNTPINVDDGYLSHIKIVTSYNELKVAPGTCFVMKNKDIPISIVLPDKSQSLYYSVYVSLNGGDWSIINVETNDEDNTEFGVYPIYCINVTTYRFRVYLKSSNGNVVSTYTSPEYTLTPIPGVDSVEIVSVPWENEGDVLNPDGLKVKLNYADSTSQIITYGPDNTSLFDIRVTMPKINGAEGETISVAVNSDTEEQLHGGSCNVDLIYHSFTSKIKSYDGLGKPIYGLVSNEHNCAHSLDVEYDYGAWVTQGDGTHKHTSVLGQIDVDNCASDEYESDADNHWKICTVCNGSFSQEAHVCGNTYTGNTHTHWLSCETCNAKCSEANHAYGEWVSNNNGTHTHTCTATGCTASDTINCVCTAVVTPPTCVIDGYTTHTCPDCAYSYTDTTVPALGHTYGAWVSNNNGTHTHTCTATGCTASETINCVCTAVETPPTCVIDGYTTHTCPDCAYSYTDTTVPALGHTYGAWVSNNNGTHTHTCTATGCTASDTINCVCTAVVTPPTCVIDGYTTHTCPDCAYIYIDTRVPALGHTYRAWVSNNDGTHKRTCTVRGCNHIETADCTYDEVVTEPTCTEEGYTTHTCSVCGYSYVDSHIAARHSFGKWGFGKGILPSRTCESCGYSEDFVTFIMALINAIITMVKTLKDPPVINP